ncbi:hypothetical protein CDAR_112121 [Caerostris darwini]|uniref:Mitochondrial import inner membrane translocase subunit TIM22 n=1 Tax=Caerostris darwini TaxID=1538125 RepID=A0AAV4VFP4_9ARAC|nr:hypothetical protein CDAR_112121 [Caerostris darwini]
MSTGETNSASPGASSGYVLSGVCGASVKPLMAVQPLTSFSHMSRCLGRPSFEENLFSLCLGGMGFLSGVAKQMPVEMSRVGSEVGAL